MTPNMDSPGRNSSVALAIPFALDPQGQWRDVDEVHRGLACGCFCPACEGPVVAKQGEVRIHHFAHHDRRDCRYALEASLFGMAVTLLAETGARISLPPEGDKLAWVPVPEAIFTDAQQTRFFAERWVIPAQRLALGKISVTNSSIQKSDATRADLILPEQGIEIHFLSHQKNEEKVRAALADGQDVAVLAIDLRAYARLWLETCDAEKDEHMREAIQAKEVLRRWLADAVTGRSWIYHPELKRKRARLDEWMERKRKARRMREEREQAELREQMAKQLAANEPWVIPFYEHNEDPATGPIPALPVGGRDRRLRPLAFKRTVRQDVNAWLQVSTAAELGLYWDRKQDRWVFVSAGGISTGLHGPEFHLVPTKLRNLLETTGEWQPVYPCDQGQLQAAQVPESTIPPQDSVTPETPRVEPEAELKDEVIAEGVGVCRLCGAPQHKVVFRSGPFVGRKGIQCSLVHRHPLTIL
ncbi:MAG: competence protein CoiA family protein [Lacunisphaera sp.]|nr:competence protein CoiA family protein [Lacunisphaera sp.]